VIKTRNLAISYYELPAEMQETIQGKEKTFIPRKPMTHIFYS